MDTHRRTGDTLIGRVGLAPVWAVAGVSLVPCVLMVVLLVRSTTVCDVFGAALWFGIVITAWALGALGTVLDISVIVIADALL